MTKNLLSKGGIVIALFYWSWFSFAAHSKERNILLITLVSAPVIILVTRLLALNLPFRLRPIHNEDLDFVVPFGISKGTLDGWSSFPSDHAVLYFAIAVGIFAASKRLGLVAIIYTLIFILLPRVYAGFHYPTDVLGGCVIGGILMSSSIYLFASGSIVSRITTWSEKNVGIFYALFFLITFQIANLFAQSREIAGILLRVVTR